MEKLRVIYYYVYYLILSLFFGLDGLLNKRGLKPLIIFDIDNTLAFTREEGPSPDFNLILPNINLCNAASIFSNDIKYDVIFLSVRPLNSFFATKRWLDRYIESNNNHKLFFTKTPSQKIDLLLAYKKLNSKILIDDMSYNIGNEVILFRSVLDRISKEKLSFLGLDFINKTKEITASDIVDCIEKKINT